MSKYKHTEDSANNMGNDRGRVKLRDITKTFNGGIIANDEISLTLRCGNVHALIGENGAGKSTLMKIMYGLYTPDSGVIQIDGEQVELNGPSDAKRLGIGMVHQHFQLIERLSVAENILLSIPDTARDSTTDLSTVKMRLAELINKYGFNIAPTDIVAKLDVGQKQQVEILKSLMNNSDYLVLDEPTAALPPNGIDELLSTLRELARKGYGILIVTHKLDEAISVSDQITVLRDGQRIDTVDANEISIDNLAERMVGKKIRNSSIADETQSSEKCRTTEPVLRVKSLHMHPNTHSCDISNIDMTVYPGEIVGLAGISGNGRTELVDCLTGVREPDSGLIEIKGCDVTNLHPSAHINNGMSYIPENRLTHGCAPEMSVKLNIAKKYYNQLSNRKVINWKKVTERAEDIMNKYDVKANSAEVKVKKLSGGNIQKMIVGRELDCKPDIIVANNPTRGIDVSAEEFVHQKLVEMRKNSVGVLFISDDVDEILRMSDRILTMYEGEITHRTDTQSADVSVISDCMTGNVS
jgi:simple sugar transport system ATP-binding protein